MNSTILDLWYGNLTPCEHCGAHDAEANKLIRLLEQNRVKLCAGLSDSQKDIFQKYAECWEEYLLRIQELAFCAGFSLGSKLVVESCHNWQP